jgi:ABC-type dipeptide/oligopeptide/nickel transport system permease component
MFIYILRRMLLTIPTLFGMTLLVFLVLAMGPGGVGGAMLAAGNGNVRGAEAAHIRAYYEKRYHINDHLYVQYFRWLNLISPIGWRMNDDGNLTTFGLKRPSFGESMARNRPVADLIKESLPLTLLLNAITIPIIYGFGIVTGLRAAQHRGKAVDTVFGATQLATWSIPIIWMGVMLIGFLASERYLRLFPTGGLNELDAEQMNFLPTLVNHVWVRGWLFDRVWHLILPIVCLTYGGSAFLTKLVRGSVLENLNADYARTARAKGVDEHTVLYVHVFRNSLLSLITVAAAILPSLLTGSFIVEKIFGIPGMGQLGVEAALFQDREVLLAVTLIGGGITLLSTLLRDILYAVADPRVSYG